MKIILDYKKFVSIKIYRVLLFFVLLLNILPVWIVERPPLVDYPNHLARTFIISNYEHFKDLYELIFEPVPNMAMDMVIPLLVKLYPDIEVAGKLFLTVEIILLILGCHILAKNIHGFTYLGLVGGFIVYNSMFLYGFVNYIFGISMFLITFAYYYKNRNTLNSIKLIVLTGLVFMSYLCHLSSYIFLFVSFSVCIAYKYIKDKEISFVCLSIIPLVPTVISFLVFMKGTGQIGTIYPSNMFDKLVHIVSLFIGYNYIIDSMIILVFVLLLAYLVAKASDKTRIKKEILIIGIIFLILFIISPRAIFSSFGADARFVPPGLIFMIMAFRFQLLDKAKKFLFISLMLIFIFKIFYICCYWEKLDRNISQLIPLFNSFEEGEKIFPIVMLPINIQENKIERPLYHVIHYSTIYKKTFSPTIFAIRGQNILVTRKYYEYFLIDQSSSLEKIEWEKIFNNYDYIWCYKVGVELKDYFNRKFNIAVDGKDVIVYKIKKNS